MDLEGPEGDCRICTKGSSSSSWLRDQGLGCEGLEF